MTKIHSLAELNAEIKQLETRSKVAEAHLKQWFDRRVRHLKKELATIKRSKGKSKKALSKKKKVPVTKTAKKTKKRK